VGSFPSFVVDGFPPLQQVSGYAPRGFSPFPYQARSTLCPPSLSHHIWLILRLFPYAGPFSFVVALLGLGGDTSPLCVVCLHPCSADGSVQVCLREGVFLPPHPPPPPPPPLDLVFGRTASQRVGSVYLPSFFLFWRADKSLPPALGACLLILPGLSASLLNY